MGDPVHTGATGAAITLRCPRCLSEKYRPVPAGLLRQTGADGQVIETREYVCMDGRCLGYFRAITRDGKLAAVEPVPA